MSTAKIVISVPMGKPAHITQGALTLHYSLDYPVGWEHWHPALQEALLSSFEDTGILGSNEVVSRDRILSTYYQKLYDCGVGVDYVSVNQPVEWMVVPLLRELYTPLQFVCGDLDLVWMQVSIRRMATRHKLLAVVDFAERFDCQSFFTNSRIGA